jgi:hypothetical protein
MSIPKFAAEQANNILSRLDKSAGTIQANYEKWGMSFEVAREICNDLDKSADEIEEATFGKESFVRRQAEVISKTAEVIRREPDEPYMDTFKVNPEPVQIEADEPYMKLYDLGDPNRKTEDQSSNMLHGISTTNRPLTPHSKDTPKPQGM